MKKRNIILTVLFVIAILVCAFFMQDGGTTPNITEKPDVIKQEGMWKDAEYLEDTELGTGEKTLYVLVSAEGQAIEFTIHTDKKTVGEALSEHKLIDGEKGPYGLYVKKVNSMEADYDKTKTYWAFNKNGESVMTGVDLTEFADKDRFELACTK